MKKIFLSIALLIAAIAIHAQGLQGLVVEKYYVSNAADATGSASNSGGTLPTGSITWRFYADLQPGYKLQAVYGVDVVPTGTVSAGDHELRLQTTTTFFNNEDRGATTPTFTKAQTARNSVMLDSWISVGAACSGYFGIPKTSDDGVNNTVNINGILANNAPAVGIPLTTQDGLIAGAPEAVTTVGLSPTDLSVFDATSGAGSVFATYNGSWASLNGAIGPDASNRVLIAQITTDGVLTYNFNIQVGTPTGGTERYVSSNPVGVEILNSSLSGVLNQPNACPTVAVTAPTAGSTYFVSDNVAIEATAADANGTVSQVEFFVNGSSVGVDNTAPYTASYTATLGTKNITAVATDNDGCSTTSSIVTVTVGQNAAPTVSITAPAAGTIVDGVTVNITANAADADGSITQVEFFVDNVSIGVDNSSPYAATWVSTIGNHSITAKATDNNSATTTSAAVALNVISSSASYLVGSSANPCDVNTFCVPVSAVVAVNDVIGYDVVLSYDKTKVQPTGAITVRNNLVNPSYVSTANSIDAVNGRVYLSLYFNSIAPATAEFNGTGELFCVEFVKTAGFNAIDTAQFAVTSLQESYFNGVQTKIASSGNVSSTPNSRFTSNLNFWMNGSPLGYDGTGLTTLRTDIYGTDNNCANQSATSVQPDTLGNFTYDLSNGSSIKIERNILNTTSVQPVVNGFDAFLVRRVLINDASFIPSAYQMIAMDVNIDGVISAGDLSQINQRAVLILGEFKQAWNYSPSGSPLGPQSKDWVFVDQSALNAPAYQISSTFPFDDNSGFSKARVPVTPFCHEVPVFGSTSCISIDLETYTGILLGDVNGNFSAVQSGGVFKQEPAGKVILDLAKATRTNGYIDIPVEITADQDINAVDLAVKFDETKLTYNSTVSPVSYLSLLDNFNTADRTLRVTSSSLNKIEMNQPLFAVRFLLNPNTTISEMDFNSAEAFLNGDKVNLEFKKDIATGVNEVEGGVQVSVFPNPATNFIAVRISERATVQLMDISGKQVIAQMNVNANEKQNINTENIAAGVYLLKVSNDNFTTTKRVVVSK